jgi:pimeloyl-ACP methyl ester carboxylesterase
MSMMKLRLIATAAAVAMLPVMFGPTAAQTIAAPEKPTQVAVSTAAPSTNGARPAANNTGAHVYLLRGLLNIFSLGMDDLAAKIQARGISASVHNHSEWQTLADDIAARYKARRHGPVILVGHSLGADAVMYMAEYLGTKGVPVALVVPFDGTGSFAAASNVSRVMNLTQRDYAYMRRGNGFRGELQNIDVSRDTNIGHINIDKSPRLHAMVVNKIASVVGRGGGAPAAPKPAAPVEAKPAAPTDGKPELKPAVGNAAAPAVTPASAPSGASASAAPAASSAPATNASASAAPAAAAAAPATTSSVPAVR